MERLVRAAQEEGIQELTLRSVSETDDGRHVLSFDAQIPADDTITDNYNDTTHHSSTGEATTTLTLITDNNDIRPGTSIYIKDEPEDPGILEKAMDFFGISSWEESKKSDGRSWRDIQKLLGIPDTEWKKDQKCRDFAGARKRG